MDPTLLALVLGSAFGALILFFISQSHRAQVARLTRPTSTVDSARPGPVKLLGTVEADELFTSPASERRCVYMRIVIDDQRSALSRAQLDQSRKRRPGYSTRRGMEFSLAQDDDTVHEQIALRMTLDDGTGQVLVSLDGADFELLVDQAVKTSRLTPNDPTIDRLLRQFSIKGEGGPYLITETILEPGDRVLVIGQLTTDEKGRDIVTGTEENPVLITDKDAKKLTAATRSKATTSMFFAIGLAVLAAVFGVMAFMGG